MPRKVVFTKYVDPLCSNDHEEDSDDFDNDQEWEFTKASLGIPRKVYKGNVFISQLGVVPLGANLASVQNKIFVGHTNFRLTQRDKDLVNAVEGVEGWDVLSPYRFKIMIGWLFKDDEIKSNIQHTLCDELKQEQKNHLQYAGNISFPYWANVELKTGKMEIISGKTPKDIENKLDLRKDIAKIIETSWEKNANKSPA